jgi:hypothetical protein
MFIGENSLTRFAAFIRGYDFALDELGQPAEPFFEGFQSWVVQRLRMPDCYGWDTAILRYCHSEAEALNLFWELLDEYTAHDGQKAKAAEPQTNGSPTTNFAATQESRP